MEDRHLKCYLKENGLLLRTSLASERTEVQTTRSHCSLRIPRAASSTWYRHQLPLSTSPRPFAKCGRRIFFSSSIGRQLVAGSLDRESRITCSKDEYESNWKSRPNSSSVKIREGVHKLTRQPFSITSWMTFLASCPPTFHRVLHADDL